MIVGWDSQDLWTNYAFGGSYVDNGGAQGEEAESDVQTEALKAAMTEYAALQNTFGIVDKTQEEYKQMFINNQLIYTILDSTQLADLNASGVDYGICAVPGQRRDLVRRAFRIRYLPWSIRIRKTRTLPRQ